MSRRSLATDSHQCRDNCGRRKRDPEYPLNMSEINAHSRVARQSPPRRLPHLPQHNRRYDIGHSPSRGYTRSPDFSNQGPGIAVMCQYSRNLLSTEKYLEAAAYEPPFLENRAGRRGKRHSDQYRNHDGCEDSKHMRCSRGGCRERVPSYPSSLAREFRITDCAPRSASATTRR